MSEIIKKPWGSEEIIYNGKYVVKKLIMKAGNRCSYQSHNIKTETIIVTKGVLDIIGENSKTIIHPGESITILPNTKHRMEANVTDTSYIECSTTELNDIVRYEDDYGRI